MYFRGTDRKKANEMFVLTIPNIQQMGEELSDCQDCHTIGKEFIESNDKEENGNKSFEDKSDSAKSELKSTDIQVPTESTEDEKLKALEEVLTQLEKDHSQLKLRNILKMPSFNKIQFKVRINCQLQW